MVNAQADAQRNVCSGDDGHEHFYPCWRSVPATTTKPTGKDDDRRQVGNTSHDGAVIEQNGESGGSYTAYFLKENENERKH